MASNTREARKVALNKRETYGINYMNRLILLFNNSVKVKNQGDLPKRYLLKVLLEQGGIAYDKQTQLYLPYVEQGINVYGLPTKYRLIGYNGFNVSRSPEEVVILRANDYKIPLINYFRMQVDKLVDFDMAIEQNLEACKTMTIAECSDQATLLSMANEIEARRIGATVCFQNKTANVGNEVKVQSTGAQYLVTDLLSARKEILNETFSTIGISVANVDKRERVQGMEVLASQGYALDSLSTLIDTFNYDAEYGGIDIRLEGNTTLINNELEITNNEVNDNDTL